MNYIQGLAQRISGYHKRYIGFRRSLCTRNHIDTIASQSTEQFSGYTRSMFHILTYNSHSSQSAFRFHRANLSHFDFLRKFFIQNIACQSSIFITDTDRSRVFRRSLRHQEYTDSILCQSLEDTMVYSDHSHHT